MRFSNRQYQKFTTGILFAVVLLFMAAFLGFEGVYADDEAVSNGVSTTLER